MSRTDAANQAWALGAHARRMKGVDLSWWDAAPCRGTDPEVFFDPELEDLAKSFCATCTVTEECLNYCLTIHNRHDGVSGVWGGLGSVEIRKLLRQHRKTA